jgi:nitrite reductase/ring-hydroxylating ferredoxin subunit
MEWVRIFPSGNVAREKLQENKPQLLIVHGKRICLVLRSTQFYALEDTCSHSGESLSKGIINYLGEIVCPWHAYRFSLASGRESGERSRDLISYPIQEDETGFYIGV